MMKKMKRRTGSANVEVSTTVEIGDVEREVTLTFCCSAGEAQTRQGPAFPAEAEFQSATFDDDGSDASEHIDPDDFTDEALEQADEEDQAAYDSYCDAEYERRKEEKYGL